MLATAGELPVDDGSWAYEMKWDGVRAIAYLDGGRVRLQSRSGRDITQAYPELGGLAAAWSGNGAVLDGEIVGLGSGTSPSFGALQQRVHPNAAAEVRRLATAVPV